METKKYVILSSYTDFDGGNADCWGIYPTREKAIEAMPKVILDYVDCKDKDEYYEEYEEAFDDLYCNDNKTHWVQDEYSDGLLEFYIQEVEEFD